jgi:hypothetical protein
MLFERFKMDKTFPPQYKLLFKGQYSIELMKSPDKPRVAINRPTAMGLL